MATLKELTQRIVEGDAAILKKQDEGNKKLSSIDAGIKKFLTNAERDKLDQEEDRRESRRAQAAALAASEKRAQGWVEAAQGSSAASSNWIKDILAALSLGNIVKSLGGLLLKLSGVTAALAGIRNAIDRGLNTPRGQQLNEADKTRAMLREEKLRQQQLEKDARERARVAERDAKAAEARMKAARAIQDAEAAERARVQAERARAKAEAERINQRAAREAAAQAKANEKAAANVRRIANEYKGYGEARREAARLQAEQQAREAEAAKAARANRRGPTAPPPSVDAATVGELDKVTTTQLTERGFTREYAENGRTRYRDASGRYVDANTVLRGLGYATSPTTQASFDVAEALSRYASRSTTAPVAALGRTGMAAIRAVGSVPGLAIQFALMPSELADGTIVGAVVKPYNDMVNAMMEGKSKSTIIGHFDEFKKQIAMFPELKKQFPDLFEVAKLTNDQIMTTTSMLYAKTTGKIYTSKMAFGTATGRETIGVGSVSSSGFGINSYGEIAQGAVLSGSELNALDMISERNRQMSGIVYAPTVNNGGNTNVNNGGMMSRPTAPPVRDATNYDFFGSGR